MKDRYTIGEVAELLNMSPQSLRFYDKAGVVVPAYTNPKTGYRYYSYDQIHYIDRVKYLQRFGFTLEDIRDALDTNDVSRFRMLLMQRQEQIRQEVSHYRACWTSWTGMRIITATRRTMTIMACPTSSGRRSGIF